LENTEYGKFVIPAHSKLCINFVAISPDGQAAGNISLDGPVRIVGCRLDSYRTLAIMVLLLLSTDDQIVASNGA